MKRDFKGIWIPKEVWLNKDLTVMEKLFLVEIDSLDNADGCFASNKHFSEFFQLSKQRCTEIIKRLEKKGFLTVKLKRKGEQIIKRVIKVNGYSINRTTLFGKPNNPIRETEQPYSENTKDNNTSINNTNREIRALDFLQQHSPQLFEAFQRNYKNKLTDYKKFTEDFNDKVDVEDLEYTVKKINARLNSYARNWVANNAKFTVIHSENTKPNYLKDFSA